MHTTCKQVQLISGQPVRERVSALSAKQANLIRDRSTSSSLYDSRVVIYAGRGFIRLVTDLFYVMLTKNASISCHNPFPKLALFDRKEPHVKCMKFLIGVLCTD